VDAFEKLYREHASAVFRFAWGLCGDRASAEDLVSETFVRILTRAPRIETRTALAYLLAVARNVHLSGWRRRRREVPLEPDLAAPETDWARRMDERDDLDRVLKSLGTLTEGERAALLLRVEHELPYDEIAAVLGVSASAAKVRVHRARLRLATARTRSTADATARDSDVTKTIPKDSNRHGRRKP
jgi:RNA polymerase sigma-70 factor (ECF subfamily)